MRTTTPPLPPSSSLPPLGTLSGLSGREIFGLLHNLSALYCPLPVPACPPSLLHAAHTRAGAQKYEPVDSGYTSEADGPAAPPPANEAAACGQEGRRIAGLRADPFERALADRWLAGFIARAPTLHCLAGDDELCERAVDQAAYILESILGGGEDGGGQGQVTDDSGEDFVHELAFDLLESGLDAEDRAVRVRLQDRIAGGNEGDHDDVGLQLWGSSVIFSELVCSSPSRFGLDVSNLGPSPRIIELGAGTGLVSLLLGTVLPRLGVSNARIIATDYHPAVLENLRANIALGGLPVETSLLDWSSPTLPPALDSPAKLLLATDVVYGPEHAVLLRDCAARLLAPGGVFWMLNAVRKNGRFEDVVDTVEKAFAREPPVNGEGKTLKILSLEALEKRKGVGRGDESGYKLFRIGWA